jgi:transcriptional regulator
MYDISYFKAKDQQAIFDFMQANPFVTICGVDANGLPIAAQIPVLIKQVGDEIIISGHLMRKQDHTNAFEINANALVIFSAAMRPAPSSSAARRRTAR